MGRYLVATIKKRNINNYHELTAHYKKDEFFLIERKEELNVETIDAFNPDYIFFPHWSWVIPSAIYENYRCVVFHMTDLPFGRGGSPLQNLLVRGIYDTKISAIKVASKVDAGPIYFKESINISEGSADEIFARVSDIIYKKMIPKFISGTPIATEQIGEIVYFKRRTPEQSEIPNELNQRQIYDYIRMLDGEGYPSAYKIYDKGKVYYTNAKYFDGVVTAIAQFEEDEN